MHFQQKQQQAAMQCIELVRRGYAANKNILQTHVDYAKFD